MSAWSWKKLLAATKVIGRRASFTKDDDFRYAARAIGVDNLPPSYREFIAHFGAGVWHPELGIYPPRHPTNRRYAIPHVVHLYREVTENMGKYPQVYDDVEDIDVLKGLLRFARPGYKYHMCWDPSRRNANGEMAICIVEPNYGKVTYCGKDLLDFLGNYWIGGKLNRVCPLVGGDSWDGKPSFTCMKTPKRRQRKKK